MATTKPASASVARGRSARPEIAAVKRRDAELHGVLVVDKPSGPTSHDVVAGARRAFGTRRVGHAGTLDPMASGVLVLLFGEATKLSSVASGHDKTYLAEVTFGRSTTSLDAWGDTTDEVDSSVVRVGDQELERALAVELARCEQVPPSVSAIKVRGRRAHALTRSGAPPVLEPRPVQVRHLEIAARTQASLVVRLRVSAGYYVRSLARDLGSSLSLPSHLSMLRREESGPFSLRDARAWPPESIELGLDLGAALARVAPGVRLCDEAVLKARQGKLLQRTDFLDDPDEARERWLATAARWGATQPACQVWAWMDAEGAAVALGQTGVDGYRVRRGFKPRAELQTE